MLDTSVLIGLVSLGTFAFSRCRCIVRSTPEGPTQWGLGFTDADLFPRRLPEPVFETLNPDLIPATYSFGCAHVDPALCSSLSLFGCCRLSSLPLHLYNGPSILCSGQLVSNAESVVNSCRLVRAVQLACSDPSVLTLDDWNECKGVWVSRQC